MADLLLEVIEAFTHEHALLQKGQNLIYSGLRGELRRKGFLVSAFFRVLFARALQAGGIISSILVSRRRCHILVGIIASLI